MDRDMAPCLHCGADVPETAAACPACDYDLAHHDRSRLLLGGLGMALSLTGVLAPLGLPVLWLARRHRMAAEGTVTARSAGSLREQFVATLRSHLGLRARPGRGEFPRGGTPDGRTQAYGLR